MDIVLQAIAGFLDLDEIMSLSASSHAVRQTLAPCWVSIRERAGIPAPRPRALVYKTDRDCVLRSALNAKLKVQGLYDEVLATHLAYHLQCPSYSGALRTLTNRLQSCGAILFLSPRDLQQRVQHLLSLDPVAWSLGRDVRWLYLISFQVEGREAGKVHQAGVFTTSPDMPHFLCRTRPPITGHHHKHWTEVCDTWWTSGDCILLLVRNRRIFDYGD